MADAGYRIIGHLFSTRRKDGVVWARAFAFLLKEII
jgi:hypothetical protein